MDCQPAWRNLVDSTWRAAQSLLWPPICLLCGARCRNGDIDLCSGCHGELAGPPAARCLRCAQALSYSAGPGALCGQCLRHPPRFDRSFCPFTYEAAIAHLIRSFKYRGNLACGRLLAQLFCERVSQRREPLPDAIVPVPLATRRYRQRGFNQAIELGQCIGRHIGVPLRTELVVRTRETAEQAGLKPHQRRRNVRRAFAVTRTVDVRRVAILDDVMTTGSTANEVARVLRAAGVLHVEVWAIARAGKQA